MSRSAPLRSRRKPLSASISGHGARIGRKAAGFDAFTPVEAADAAPHAGSQYVLARDHLTMHLQKAIDLCRTPQSRAPPE
jgi:hypothetical protein